MAWTTPRTWVASEVVSASIMNTHVRDNLNVLKTSVNDDGTLAWAKYARKTSNQTTTSTTLANVTDLSFAISASQTWLFHFALFLAGDTTADYGFAVTFPTSPTSVRYGVTGTNPNSDNTLGLSTATAGQAVAIQAHSSTVDEMILLDGIVVNGANSGNVQLQWRLWTDIGGNITLYANSYVWAYRIA